ncbi:hypothetical protein T4D_13280 [Trichinella pseudospiralis]|uniref:Uncharacterized protein n=1 Tax=Trichinella pseudospiralis TaxID=6337 RepID=A0A0V1FEW8_TRIPS|nr:hypothetical protein T4D_13280 [Trichinella pseudospiralis]
MRIICTTHNVSEAKITNQLIDTCVVRRLTAVCKEPTHIPSEKLFKEEIYDRQVTRFVYAAACQLGANYYRTPANRLPLLRSVIERDHNIRFTMSTPCTTIEAHRVISNR